MKNYNYFNLPKLSGIYRILCVVTNKFYIGSSIVISDRVYEHIRTLKNNIHYNKYLQRAWNKYGVENFKFDVIETVDDINILLQREQYYLDLYKSYDSNIGFNIQKDAIGRRNGIELSHEELKNLSESHIGNGHRIETKEKIRNSISKTNKQKLSFKIITPEGKVVNVCGLFKFCKENGLNPSYIKKVLIGEIDQHKGYKRGQDIIGKQSQKAPVKAIFSKDGKEVMVDGINRFWKREKLDSAAVYRLMSGKSKYHKGWTFIRRLT